MNSLRTLNFSLLGLFSVTSLVFVFGDKAINSSVKGMNSVALVCILFPRGARTAEEGLLRVPKSHSCLMQGVRWRG